MSASSACDEICAVDRICEGGRCVCADGLEDCGVVCVDTERDPASCGECGNACPWGGSCRNGVCDCPPGTQLCDDACVDTNSDPDHCGDCFQRCVDVLNAGMPICRDGECRFDCDFGYADCDGDWKTGCETQVLDDQDHCGACNLSCDGLPDVESASCAMGSCHIHTCAEGRGNCDFDPTTGCESDTTSDPENCGSCGVSCNALPRVDKTSCEEGTCVFTCEEGWDDCDGNVANGCEADLLFGTTGHCGACDVECGASEVCWDGECAADPIYANWPIPPEGPTAYDYDTRPGIVIDLVTDLEWERSPPGNTMVIEDAKAHCATLDLHGGGWRLPTPVELFSLVDTTRVAAPMIDVTAFPGTSSAYYWTSIPDPSSTTGAMWMVNFGTAGAASHPGSRNVRCVRGTHRIEGERYVIGTDTVEDTVTGLIWQRRMASPSVLPPAAIEGCASLRLEGKVNRRYRCVRTADPKP